MALGLFGLRPIRPSRTALHRLFPSLLRAISRGPEGDRLRLAGRPRDAATSVVEFAARKVRRWSAMTETGRGRGFGNFKSARISKRLCFFIHSEQKIRCYDGDS